MAVPEQTPYIEYTVNGVATSFAVTFQCNSKDKLKVSINGIEQSPASWQFTGGSVVFGIAPIDGSVVSIKRATPLKRDTTYSSYDNSLRPETLNTDFDILWHSAQELNLKNQNTDQKFQDLLDSVAAGNVAGLPAEILARIAADERLQTAINAEEVRAYAAENARYTKTETYNKTEIDASLTAVAGGRKAYQTLALAQADQASLPANTVVDVTNDPTDSNNGTYQWNGTALTKSDYDPLTQSKNFTMLENSNLRKSIESDIFVFSSNLFDKDAVTPNTSIDTDGTIIDDDSRWLSDYIPCSPSDVFAITNGSYRVAFFDSRMNFISRTSIADVSSFSIPTLSSIAFFRLSAPYLVETIQLNTGSTLLPLEAYSQEYRSEFFPVIPREKIPTIKPNMTNFFVLSNNLFDKNEILSNKSIEFDGTIIDDDSRWLSDYIACSSQEVFSLTNGSYRVAYFDGNKNFITRSGITSDKLTALSNGHIRYIRLSSTVSPETLMLNRGEALLPYEGFDDARLQRKYAPKITISDLPLITPEATSFFEIGSNLFNKNSVLLNTSIETDGTIISDDLRWLSDYIPVEPASTFTMPDQSYRIAVFDADKNFLQRSGVAATGGAGISYAVSGDTYFVRLSATTPLASMQLNSGSILLPYEPYFLEVKKDLLPNIPLEKLPTVSPEMTDFFDRSSNLFNKNAVLLNTTIETTGVIVPDTTRWLSDYIPVEPASTFTMTDASYRIAVFDANKNFLQRSGVAPTGGAGVSYAVSGNTYFVRLSSTKNIDEVMVNKGATILPLDNYGDIKIGLEYLPEQPVIPDVDIDQIVDQVQQRIGSGLNWEPSFPKLNFSIVESGTWRIPMWMSSDGEIIYGAYGGQLLQSTDEWATRVQIGTTGLPKAIAGIRTLDDGELLISTNRDEATATNSKVYKTIGYDRNNPSAATFKEVLTTAASQANINNRWGLTAYQNICTASDYGLRGENGAQNVYLSTDYGETWRLIFNLRTQVVEGRPPLTDSAHMHTVAYDPYFNRIWVCVGDNPNTATYYSDDLGETWTFVVGSTVVQYTGIIALPDAVVFGSDRAPNGVHAYHRKDRSEMPVIKPLFLINDTPTITHVFTLPFKKDWLPNTPVYFVGNKTTESVNDTPVIMGFVDGKKAHLLYEHAGVDFLETALGPTAQGNIVSAYSTTGVAGQVIIKGQAPTWQKL